MTRTTRLRRTLTVTLALVFLGGVAAAGCQSPGPQAVVPPVAVPPLVAFVSDFGDTDDAVALCKAEMLRIAPDVQIIDICHKVTPFAIDEGARRLADCALHFPAGTVFVAVVDPGVGSARRPLAALSKRGQVFVLPDNGLLTLVADRDGLVAAHEITNPAWLAGSGLSSTFHGRDLFAPVAAHLAHRDGRRTSGSAPLRDWPSLAQVGPAIPLTDLVRRPLRSASLSPDGDLLGEVTGLDGPYGNLTTNIPAEVFAQMGYRIGQTLAVRIAGQTVAMPLVKTFADVPPGQPLVYIDSRGRVGLAINLGHFAETFKVAPPCAIVFPGGTRRTPTPH